MNTHFAFKRSIIYGLLFLLIPLIVFFRTALASKTIIVFCDVGQGDAIYIRTIDNTDVLIDAGPSREVLSCIGKHMPFYDKTIEYAFLTHPQKDHYGGYTYILDHYTINSFIAPEIIGSSTFQKLLSKLKDKKVNVINGYQGEEIDIESLHFSILWPSKIYIASRTNDIAKVLGTATFRTTKENLNNFSQVILFSQDDFDILFLGDVEDDIFEYLIYKGALDDVSLEVMKVPHHGSKNGLTTEFLDYSKPKYAIISVGKTNPFGHPSKQVLDMLNSHNIQYKTTARDGDVIIEYDNEKWYIDNQSSSF